MTSNPMIAATFRPAYGGFISRTDGDGLSCPPYVIAAVAADRAPEDALDLPAGYDFTTFDQIRFVTGYIGQDAHVSARQAAELAQIGAQLLALNAEGRINPPLTFSEAQSIEHLVHVAG